MNLRAATREVIKRVEDTTGRQVLGGRRRASNMSRAPRVRSSVIRSLIAQPTVKRDQRALSSIERARAVRSGTLASVGMANSSSARSPSSLSRAW